MEVRRALLPETVIGEQFLQQKTQSESLKTGYVVVVVTSIAMVKCTP